MTVIEHKTVKIQLQELRERIATEIESGCTLSQTGEVRVCMHCFTSAYIARFSK